MLTQSRLKELLHYDPATGNFVRLLRTGGSANVGDIAGWLMNHGYRMIRIDGKCYLAHRLAWLYMMGDWPKNQMDHRNGARNDNRWDNLREATSAENNQNRAISGRNKSGFIGVYRHGNSWRAQMVIAGSTSRLGCFATPEAAHAAYLAAKAEHHTFQPVPRGCAKQI